MRPNAITAFNYFLLGKFVILWKFNRTQVLFAGNLRIHGNEKISINDSTGTLTIKNIQMEYRFDFSFFNNNYVQNLFIYFLTISCLISTNPPQDIIHTIKVMSKSFINTLKI